jgi:phosphoenolpyruvate-protein kinase (PTS system EI component)
VKNKTIGHGISVSVPTVAEGLLRRVDTPEDVLDLLDAGPEGYVVLVEHAGATFLAPVHSELAGVLCRLGGMDSHISIISRSVGVPAMVGVVFEGEGPADGDQIRFDPTTGTIERLAP